MSYMFSNCSSLTLLPNISKWNINNVTNMSYMFYKCSSISSLPNISKLNLNNVTNMSYMFSNCSSLTSLPDISKWNINFTIIEGMFYNCLSLISFDISEYNTNPNLSRWMYLESIS